MFIKPNYKIDKHTNSKIVPLDDFDKETATFRIWELLTKQGEQLNGLIAGSWMCLLSTTSELPLQSFQDIAMDATISQALYMTCLYIEKIPEKNTACIHIYCYEQTYIKVHKGEILLPSFAYPKSHFILYDGTILIKSVMYKNKYDDVSKYYPCTLTDIYMYKPNTPMHTIFTTLMTCWGKQHRLWFDIVKDYANPSAYGAIPIKDIWSTFSLRDLVRNQFHYDGKRINKDGLGKAIFLAKVKRYVNENEFQLLYGYNPPHTKLGKRKADIAYALADFLWQKSGCDKIHPYNAKIKTVRERGQDRDIYLSKNDVEHTICVILELRQLIPLNIKTPKQLQELHDVMHLKKQAKGVRMHVPNDYAFRKLKVPDGYKMLLSKQELIEEGEYQHNCVGSYTKLINRNISCILSKREPSGERYTIEIRVERNRFIIYQYSGFGNKKVSTNQKQELQTWLDTQKPAGPMRKRRTKAEMLEAKTGQNNGK